MRAFHASKRRYSAVPFRTHDAASCFNGAFAARLALAGGQIDHRAFAFPLLRDAALRALVGVADRSGCADLAGELPSWQSISPTPRSMASRIIVDRFTKELGKPSRWAFAFACRTTKSTLSMSLAGIRKAI